MTPTQLIYEKLNNYLGFDSDIIFNTTDLISVFGGAIRDIISGDDEKFGIKDIDIICLPKSKDILVHILKEQGYTIEPNKNEFKHALYRKISVINEPITLVKGRKIVQLIRPRLHNKYSSTSMFKYNLNSYYNLLNNVDLTSSGLAYDGLNLFETVPNSYGHCKNKFFLEIEGALMYNKKRTEIRKQRLIDKGWTATYPDSKMEDISLPNLNDMKNINSNITSKSIDKNHIDTRKGMIYDDLGNDEPTPVPMPLSERGSISQHIGRSRRRPIGITEDREREQPRENRSETIRSSTRSVRLSEDAEPPRMRRINTPVPSQSQQTNSSDASQNQVSGDPVSRNDSSYFIPRNNREYNREHLRFTVSELSSSNGLNYYQELENSDNGTNMFLTRDRNRNNSNDSNDNEITF